MRQIPLSNSDKFAIVDDADYPLVSWYTWRLSPDGRYPRAKVHGKQTKMHRHIFQLTPGMVTDHINGDGLDNRRANLREATRVQNSQNKKINSNSKTGVKGIKKTAQGKFKARITVNGERITIGTFDSIEVAAAEYAEAAADSFGEFVRKVPGL